jgi:hypothetical protein
MRNDDASASHHSRVPRSSMRNIPTGTKSATVCRELQPVVVDGQQLAMPVRRIENPVVEGDA